MPAGPAVPRLKQLVTAYGEDEQDAVTHLALAVEVYDAAPEPSVQPGRSGRAQ